MKNLLYLAYAYSKNDLSIIIFIMLLIEIVISFTKFCGIIVKRVVIILIMIMILSVPLNASRSGTIVKHHKTPGITLGHEKARSYCNISMIMIGEFVDSNNNGFPEQWEIERKSMLTVKGMAWSVMEGSKKINERSIGYVEYSIEIKHSKFGPPGRGEQKETRINVTIYQADENVSMRGIMLKKGEILFELNISSWNWVSKESKLFVMYVAESSSESKILKREGEILISSVDLNITLDYNYTAVYDNNTTVPDVSILGNQIYFVYPRFEQFLSHFFLIIPQVEKKAVEILQIEYIHGMVPAIMVISAFSMLFIILIKRKLKVNF